MFRRFCIILVIGFILNSGLSAFPFANEIPLNGRVLIDVPYGFNFQSISVFTQYRRPEEKAWTDLPVRTVDSDGAFSFFVPEGSRVSIQISTSDPTVMSAGEGNAKVEFYSLGKGRKRTIFWDEFVQRIDAPRRIIRLSRGGAIELCETRSGETGYVQLVKNLDTVEKSLVFTYETREQVRNVFVGGLDPGNWVVGYYDDKSRLLSSRNIAIERGAKIQNICGR